MNTLKYVDEGAFFDAMSRLLRRDGTIAIFWTNTVGYYVWRFFTGIAQRNKWLTLYCAIRVVRGLSNRGDNDHSVAYKRTRLMAERYGLKLKRYNMTELCRQQYREEFLGIPLILNMVGRRM
jgi:hypothetical protein